MEELIKIAFSSMNSRLEGVENDIDKIYSLIQDLTAMIEESRKQIAEINMEIGMRNFTEIDEVEEYKFGK